MDSRCPRQVVSRLRRGRRSGTGQGQSIAASLADYCALDELKRWAIWRLDGQRGTYSVMRDGTSALPEAIAPKSA